MVPDNMKPVELEHFRYQHFLYTRVALAVGEAVSVALPLAQLAHRGLAAGLGVSPPAEGVVTDELRRKGLDATNDAHVWGCPRWRGSICADGRSSFFGRIWTRPGLPVCDLAPTGYQRHTNR
jgi:hypothetical protein